MLFRSNGFLALVLRTLLQRQNKKLEEEERRVNQAAEGDEKIATLPVENEGTFGYRYIL